MISFELGNNLAEVFIAPYIVKKNADLYGVKFQEEIMRCVVHGILHVIGFSDYAKKEKQKMWKKQEQLLKKVLK